MSDRTTAPCWRCSQTNPPTGETRFPSTVETPPNLLCDRGHTSSTTNITPIPNEQKSIFTLCTGLCVALHFSCSPDRQAATPVTLYFDRPATSWNEAIPIGNGRLGGMVFGGVAEERIQTNDDTFWSGEPRDVQNPSAHILPTARFRII